MASQTYTDSRGCGYIIPLIMERVEILGVEIDNLTRTEALERVRAMLRSRRPHQIITPAIEQIILTRRDPQFHEIVRQADLVVPDGMPVVFASRWSGAPLVERITGVDLVPDLCRLAAEESGSVFLLGGEPGVAEEAAQRLRESVPGLRIAGTYCPPYGFERNETEARKAVAAVRNARPDILFVALGCPKQEKWIHRHRNELGATVMIGVGGAFNFITGREKRAPVWLQNLGLEGIYRLFQRPRDIWKRIIINAPYFFLLLFDLLTYRLQKRLARWVRPLLLSVGDIVLTPLCFLFSYWLYFRSGLLAAAADPFPERSLLDMPAYSDLLHFMAALGIAALWFNRLYERDKYLTHSDTFVRALKAALSAVFLLIGFQFLFKDIFFAEEFRGFSRVVFGVFGVAFFCAVMAWRSAFRLVEDAMHKRGLHLDRILFVGATPLARELAAAMLSNPELGNRPIGFVVEGQIDREELDGIPLLGRIEDLQRLLPARKIDEVLVADPKLSASALRAIARHCRERRIALSIVPTVHELLGASSEIKRIGPIRVMTVSLDREPTELTDIDSEADA